MSYSNLILQENIEANFLCVARPKKKLTGFTLFSGSVYSKSFDLSEFIYSVTQNGVALTAGSSTSLSAGQYYFDDINKVIYVRMSDSSNPSTKFVTVFYELYFSTYDAHWYRIPTDDTTKTVYFEPIIVNSPGLKSSIADVLFGVLPVQSTQINLGNAEHLLEPHLYDSSFNKAEFLIYHWLGKSLDVTNIKLVLKGIGSNVNYNSGTVSISLLDGIDLFNKEWRNDTPNSFFTQSDFIELDPQFIGKPIRYFYGRAQGLVPVNIDYLQDSPTTSDNRRYIVIAEQAGLTEKTYTVGGGVHTTTRTFISTSMAGLAIGDSVRLDRVSGTDESVLIIAMGANYIDHVAIPTPMTNGDTVRRGFVSRIDIIQNGQQFTALYGRDYTCNLALNNGCSGFDFSTSLEANLAMPETLKPGDDIFCTVYGRTNNVTLSGGSFGSNDADTANLTHPAVILFHLLKTKLGLGESSLNLTSFQTLLTDLGSEAIQLVIPKDVTGSFPNIKDLINEILQTSFIKIFLDSDLKWKVEKTKPMVTESKTIQSDEILLNSFSYTFDYKDIISDVIVEYNRQEKSFTTSGERVDSVTAVSQLAKYVHGVDKQKTFNSLHFKSVDAQLMADRLSFVLGDRSGEINFQSKNRFFDSYLSDIVLIQRDKMPGQEFIRDTLRDQKGVLQEISKTLRTVNINLNDQKGIEENSLNWD